MRLLFRDGDDPGRTPVAVSLQARTGDVTVADAVAAVAGAHPGSVPARPAQVLVDGVPVDLDAPVAGLGLVAGGTVTVTTAAPAWPRDGYGDGASEREMPPVPVAELRRIAGPGSGLALPLAAGTYAIAGPGLTLTVGAEGDHAVIAVGDGPVLVDGRTVEPDRTVTLTDESVMTAAGSVARLAPAGEQDLGPVREPGGGPDGAGRRPLIRTPRMARPAPAIEVPVPEPPPPPTEPAPLSWLVMLAPVPIGVAMALVFSPFFLLMAGMSPCMGLARWIEGRFRGRRDRARRAIETAEATAAFTVAVDRARVDAGAAARAAHPDLAELGGRARSGRHLWEVRPGDEDHLRVMVGVGPRPWRPALLGRGDALARQPHLAEVLDARDHLVDVPVLADLRAGTGLGVLGPRGAAGAVVGAAVIDLVTRHGPADLRLALLVDRERSADWEWAKWVPHLAADDGTVRVVTDVGAAADLLEALAVGEAGMTTVVVVDGDGLLTGAVASRLGALARAGGRALVATATPARLPAVCHTIIELDGDGIATCTATTTGRGTPGVLVTSMDADAAEPVARALAGWSDPEQSVAVAGLADRARLVDVLRDTATEIWGDTRPLSGALGPQISERAGIDAGLVADWWRRPPAGGGLPVAVGVTEHGPLVLDLEADGPHALVVGTTGAGKSELLRSLVMALACRFPPDELTFLLVDFKGGGAFDACAGLPHSVGLVSDLDEHLAARALRCLRAELRHRERRLRDAGVSDRRDLVSPSPPLPRLVIVIDEFATLAAELPGFLSALVDVAQRGRSLGIHLVLATQRPHGVVDGKIRANTNLRVALRVQDEADSRDVLGTGHAAGIDRRRPGRAFVRLGAGEVVAVQAALVSGPVPTAADRIALEPFTLVAGAPVASADRQLDGVGERADLPTELPTDLDVLLDAVTVAYRAGGYQAPRVPWPAPLPDDLDAWTLPDGDDVNDNDYEGAALAMVDLPDEQRAAVWRWRPETGGTLVLGTDPAAVGAVLAAAALGLARSRPPDRQHVVVLDGAGHGLAALSALPQVTAAVDAEDTERLTRVLDTLDAEVARRRATGPSGRLSGGAGPSGRLSGEAGPSGKAGAEPGLLVMVAGWGAVVDAADRSGAVDTAGRLERLVRDGAAVGVQLLVSAAHERGVPARLLAQLPTKLVLRLADPSGYTALGLRARDVPELQGLRAIELGTGHELQFGRYGDGTPASLAAEAARVAAFHPDAPPSPDVSVLPEVVPAAPVLASSAATGTMWRLGVGRRYRDLGVATVDLAPGMHVVVAGPPGSGRTSALRLLVAAAREARPDLAVHVVAADPDAWGPPGTVLGALDALAGWPPVGPGLLVVDGIEALGPGAGPALDRLVGLLPATAHVAVAGRVEAFRGLQSWQRVLTAARTGLLLRPDRDDGEILRVRLPRDVSLRSLPGRGYLVQGGEVEQVQVAMPPPECPPVPAGMADAALVGSAS